MYYLYSGDFTNKPLVLLPSLQITVGPILIRRPIIPIIIITIVTTQVTIVLSPVILATSRLVLFMPIRVTVRAAHPILNPPSYKLLARIGSHIEER